MVAINADCSSIVDVDVVVTCLIEGDISVATVYYEMESVTWHLPFPTY